MAMSRSRTLRRIPLTFRLMAATILASLFVSVMVALLAAEHAHDKRAAAERRTVRQLAESVAGRAAPLLHRGDQLRLAVLGAAAADLGPYRLMFLDRRGEVRLDTGLTLGGRQMGLVAYRGGFQRDLDSGEQETLVPAMLAGEVVGELRFRNRSRLRVADEFSWALLGLAFLANLSVVAVACLMCHHWLARVREVAGDTRALAAGKVDAIRRRPATGELRELQNALGELGVAMSEGLHVVQGGFVEMAVQVVDALERRGITPPGHGERTSRYTRLLADRLELLPEDRTELELAARLHDMGKLWVRSSILRKVGPLNAVERESLRQHPERAARLLECVPTLRRVARSIRHHHERYDGDGFPHGLRGERIPLGARILAIADAYDQLTSWNIQGTPLTWPDALDKLREDRGVHFDPWLLDMFEDEIRKSPQPRAADVPVMISADGVVPYKAAEELRTEVEEEGAATFAELAEGDLELLADDGTAEEEA